MKEKINEIMRSHDPYTESTTRTLGSFFSGYFIKLVLVYSIFAVLVSILISTGVSEYYEHSSSIVINFLGIMFDIDYAGENFFVSPFMIFIYVLLFFLLLGAILYLFIWLFSIIVDTKLNELDNSYRTTKLLELLTKEKYGIEIDNDNDPYESFINNKL